MKTGPEHGVVFSKTATFARGSRELSAECFVDWALFVKTLCPAAKNSLKHFEFYIKILLSVYANVFQSGFNS